jgi:hypothetical protein
MQVPPTIINGYLLMPAIRSYNIKFNISDKNHIELESDGFSAFSSDFFQVIGKPRPSYSMEFIFKDEF